MEIGQEAATELIGRDELERMSHADLRAYAKSIGCPLGCGTQRKSVAVASILEYQANGGRTKVHPWRKGRL